ncbi:hypothetical protein HDV05_004990 [Chytridiales sp. JEL 0842]|nr:hypothetical protein HDV05_004990 [Chytridiales sp. JEL 0842]
MTRTQHTAQNERHYAKHPDTHVQPKKQGAGKANWGTLQDEIAEAQVDLKVGHEMSHPQEQGGRVRVVSQEVFKTEKGEVEGEGEEEV